MTDKPLLSLVGRRIRIRLAVLGGTQWRLAAVLGVPGPTLSRWMLGGELRPSDVTDLSVALGVPSGYLVEPGEQALLSGAFAPAPMWAPDMECGR